MDVHTLQLIGTHLYTFIAGVVLAVSVTAIYQSRERYPWVPWGPGWRSVISAVIAAIVWPVFFLVFFFEYVRLYGHRPNT